MGDDKYERILIGTNGVRYRRRRPPLPPEQDDPPPSAWLPPNAPDESAPAPETFAGSEPDADGVSFVDDLCEWEGDDVDPEVGCCEPSVRLLGDRMLCVHHIAVTLYPRGSAPESAPSAFDALMSVMDDALDAMTDEEVLEEAALVAGREYTPDEALNVALGLHEEGIAGAALGLTDAQVEKVLRDAGKLRAEPDADALDRVRRRLPLGGEP